jgi:hypothetical protein
MDKSIRKVVDVNLTTAFPKKVFYGRFWMETPIDQDCGRFPFLVYGSHPTEVLGLRLRLAPVFTLRQMESFTLDAY